jgi:hypothetical protein
VSPATASAVAGPPRAPDLLDRAVHGLRQLLGGGDTPQLLHQALLLALVAREEQAHVHRDANGARLIGERTHDRLPDPPDAVRREAQAPLGLELLHRAEETEVPLLDQVGQRQPAVQVAPRDLHHEPQVRLDEMGLRGLVAGPRPAREVRFLIAREELDARDLLQVYREVRAARLARLVTDLGVFRVDEHLDGLVRDCRLELVTHRRRAR